MNLLSALEIPAISRFSPQKSGATRRSACMAHAIVARSDFTIGFMIEPRSYPEWRNDRVGRWRDAFHAFGHLWFSHARDKALQTIPASTSGETRALVVKAVDTALYNTMMILDGVVVGQADAEHRVEFALIARVREKGSPERSETFELAPNGEESACMGFHIWAEGDFRA